MKKKILVFSAFIAITLTLTLFGISLITPSQAKEANSEFSDPCIAGSGGCIADHVWYDYKEGPVEQL
jgi:hypothetical protein